MAVSLYHRWKCFNIRQAFITAFSVPEQTALTNDATDDDNRLNDADDHLFFWI